MQITDGIHRIGTGLVNAYLVAEAGGVTIIDAGLAGYWGLLATELRAMGRSLDDVRAVVLTHGHPDHIGFAERARRERGIAVSVHELDALLAQGKVRNPARGTGPVRPIPLLRFLATAMRFSGWQIQHLGAVATYGDGATLDVPGSPRVVLVPGHTPGSAVLALPDRRVLFAGDALATIAVTTGIRGPQLAPFTADPVQAMASLDRIAAFDADWILPGHGEPWTGGTEAAVAAVRRSAGA